MIQKLDQSDPKMTRFWIKVIQNSIQIRSLQIGSLLLADKRYSGKFTEIKKDLGKSDRVEQDAILNKFQISIEMLPLKALRKCLYKAHKPARLRNQTTVVHARVNDQPRAQIQICIKLTRQVGH